MITRTFAQFLSALVVVAALYSAGAVEPESISGEVIVYGATP